MQVTNNYITSIKFLDEEPINQYSFEDKFVFKPLSRVNLLIGPNNSGKSRFLRQLFKIENFLYKTENISGAELISFVDDIVKDLKETVFIGNIVGLGKTKKSTFPEFRNRITDHISIKNNFFDEYRSLLTIALDTTGGLETTGSSPPSVREISNVRRNLINVAKNHIQKLNNTNIEQSIIKKIRKYYIPIIRGMRPLDENAKNFYQDRTLKDYFNNSIKKEENYYQIIFTGIELYESLKSKLLGEPEDREDIRKFENFLSSKFFNDRHLTLIPRDKADTVFIKIGDEEQLPIYHLGDGLQNLIIVTYNIFLEKEQCFFFIEEPDLAMHPGLQRTLIEEMIGNTQHQFFITTHSNHLLDLTLDYSNISVFHFSKKIKDAKVTFNVEPKSNYERNLLQDLGVKNSSVFLANSSIWVEGITDRLYLRSYMKKYIEENHEISTQLSFLKEDIDYTFVEYQGSNITHWDFSEDNEFGNKIKVSFLCGNPIVVADGDITKRKTRIEELFETLKDRFIKLNCKEIENLIPESILRLYLTRNYKNEFNDIDSIKFLEYCVMKKGLGKYLDSKKDKDSSKIFSTKSGTIKNKIKFCNDIISIMEEDNSWSLPEEVKEVCKKIFDHIIESKL